jgi:hypothetical protein
MVPAYTDKQGTHTEIRCTCSVVIGILIDLRNSDFICFRPTLYDVNFVAGIALVYLFVFGAAPPFGQVLLIHEVCR